MLKLFNQKHRLHRLSKLKEEFDQVKNAAAEQKSQNDAINLIDDVLDEDNPFR